MRTGELFTIGHSNRTIDDFIRLNDRNGCTLVADVRSTPYSRRIPHFERELLSKSLNDKGIEYLFLGKELGASRIEACLYVEGVARYHLIATAPAFRSGLDVLFTRSEVHRIVMMCSELDPMECHRCNLICKYIADRFKIYHVLDKSLTEAHEQTEERLLRRFKLDGESLFDSRSQRFFHAYEQQVLRIAYRFMDIRSETTREHLT